MNKFAGIGLTNVLVIGLFTILLIVGMKIATAKYPVPGLTEVIQSV